MRVIAGLTALDTAQGYDLGLSARAHDRVLKVARTIADTSEVAEIKPKHLGEARQYQTLDRSHWA
ncbi:MAG TPA: hypothetical protein VMR90_00795 [Candidatus Cybelea sp.]|nr:hypothetical protein [Candidatus Cybelea sp.]